jgi:CheY-like chemotaxis protein
MKVGILEDNKEQLKERKLNLEESNLAKVTIWASNSTEFIEMVNKDKPDAIFLDIDLGNDSLTGLEVAYKLKLPVMFVSSYNAQNLKDIEALQRELEFPVSHITKPFSENDFIKTAKRFLKEVDEFVNSSFVYLNFKDSKNEKVLWKNIVFIETDPGKGGESNNKRMYFSDRKPEILNDFSFTKMEINGFDSRLFVTTHKSYRVNAEKIKRYDEILHAVEVECLTERGLKEKKLIPVSENYRKVIKSLRY